LGRKEVEKVAGKRDETRLSLPEQETIIRWDEQEGRAVVYTASPKVKARMEKMGLKPVREEGPGAWYDVPRGAVRLKLNNRMVKIAGEGPRKEGAVGEDKDGSNR
jgi:hypothetical protein